LAALRQPAPSLLDVLNLIWPASKRFLRKRRLHKFVQITVEDARGV
jgi:hypothetical protein